MTFEPARCIASQPEVWIDSLQPRIGISVAISGDIKILELAAPPPKCLGRGNDMSSVVISEAPTTGLGRLIKENQFYVPTHQRDYKWDRDRVQRFIDDLVEAMDRGDQFYFIGLMVFMHEAGKLRVLDGQQRLATTIILLSALRAWFGAAGNQLEASRIQDDFIGRTEYGETEAEPRLTLNRNNDDKFQKYVITGSSLDEIKTDLKKTNKNAPNRELLDAIVYSHQRIAELAPKTSDAKKYFADFIKFVRDSVVAVRLTVPNESNAFRVFETLNDRGMDLSAVDLIKNYLFGLVYAESNIELQKLEHRWGQLTQTLQNLRQDDFLKVYWTSRHGLIQLDDIFEAVKTSAKTSKAAKDLSIDLLDAAQDYAALDDPLDSRWSGQTEDTKNFIGRLKILGSKLIRPVIMSGMKKLGPVEFEKLLRVLEVIVVRWQVVGGGRTGTIERNCARLAEMIWAGKATDRKSFIDALSELYTQDDDFRIRFATQNNLTAPKAIYLLKYIEEHERNNSGASQKGLGIKSDLTLEHILPENPGPGWKGVIDKDKALPEMADRTGNFCLLPQKVNKDLGNAEFMEKLKAYKESELLTTRQVASFSQWDSNAIVQRQEWLAARAVSVWRYS